MRPFCHFVVQGVNDHTVSIRHLDLFQRHVAETGANFYPLFLKLGGKRSLELQPVVARALLAELHLALRNLEAEKVGILRFFAKDRQYLGGMLASETGLANPKDAPFLAITPTGIRLVVRHFPPPVGFRSSPMLEQGLYECYFTQIVKQNEEWVGYRTPAMGGSGNPVVVTLPPIPAVTRWDFAFTAGRPDVGSLEWEEVPIREAFSHVVHVVDTACNESLRHKRPLLIRAD